MNDTANPTQSRRVRNRVEVGQSSLGYAAVAALILFSAVQTQNNLLFWAFGLMIGGALASFVVVWRALANVKVQRLLPDHGVVGEPLVIRYQVTNDRRWLPAFNLVIQENWGRGARGWRRHGPAAESPPRLAGPPYGWVMHLGPRQTVQAQAICWPLRRGVLEFDRIVITTSFPFGVIRRTVVLRQKGQVLVYPRIYRVRQGFWHRLAAMDPAGHLQVDRGGGTEEFFGLRRYRPGDSLRMIDWRHSARMAELISREFTQPSPPRLMLVLDVCHCQAHQPGSRPKSWWHRLAAAVGRAPPEQPLDENAEQAINLAASIICWAHLHGYQVGMQVFGAAAPYFRVHHSLPHRTRMLETLARLSPGTGPGTRQNLMVDPNVVVRATPRGMAPRRCLVLNAWEMSQHVQEVEGGAMRLLSRNILARRKRQTQRLSG